MKDLTHSISDGANAANAMACVSLACHRVEPIRSLPGFQKQLHHVPQKYNPQTQAFVARVGHDRIRKDLDHVFGLLRSAFGFKRSELDTDEPTDGVGTIATPLFRYTSSIAQDPDNVAAAVWRKDVSQVAHPSHFVSEAFASVFDGVFQIIEFASSSKVDVTSLIDRLESLEDEDMTIEYDRLASYCDISLRGSSAKIHVSSAALQVVHPKPTTPRLLIASLLEIQARINQGS